MNINTHFIDASEVYGSKANVSQRLRIMEGGLLNFTTTKNGQMFCPFLQQKKVKPVEQKYLNIQYDTGKHRIKLNGIIANKVYYVYTNIIYHIYFIKSLIIFY